MSTVNTTSPVASRDRYGLDVATAEVLAFGLENVAVQMHRALMRSAFSMVARDTADCAASIIMKTPHGWETVAHAGIAVHGVVSGHTCNFVLEEYGEENLRPGDVLFHNDPWRGAVHQSDVSCIRGVFNNGQLAFVLECCSHLVDMGGPVAGGYPIGARSTYEESLRIPPQLLYAEDVPVRGLFNFILESTRVPPMNLGDLRALYGSLVVGERLLEELCDRKGAQDVRGAALYALDTSEANIRAAIARIPDGDYTAVDVMDDDGIHAEPLRVQATVRIRRDRMEVDFSGTERQCEGNSTTAWCDSTRGIIPVKMMLDPNPRH
jgi:N-methylhydantoinase B